MGGNSVSQIPFLFHNTHRVIQWKRLFEYDFTCNCRIILYYAYFITLLKDFHNYAVKLCYLFFQEHAKEVQVLLHHMTDGTHHASTQQARQHHENHGQSATTDSWHHSPDDEELMRLRSKVQQLEKDLYFYKKTARDLKHRLKGSSSISSKQNNIEEQPAILKDSLEV